MVRDASQPPDVWTCRRCGGAVHPGRGDFYVVKIEAVADPTPPEFTEEDLQRDHALEVERLLDELRQLSQQELVDQVYRRWGFLLCVACYRSWSDDPTK